MRVPLRQNVLPTFTKGGGMWTIGAVFLMVLPLLSLHFEEGVLTGRLNSGVQLEGPLGTWDVTCTGSKADLVQRRAPNVHCFWEQN